MTTSENKQEESNLQKIDKVLTLYCTPPIGLGKKKDKVIAIPLFQLEIREDKLRQMMTTAAEKHEIMCTWDENKRNAAIDALLKWRFRPQSPVPKPTIFAY